MKIVLKLYEYNNLTIYVPHNLNFPVYDTFYILLKCFIVPEIFEIQYVDFVKTFSAAFFIQQLGKINSCVAFD